MKRNWTEEEDNYILNNYNKLTWKEMSTFLNCAIYTVKKRAESLGLEIEFKEIKPWTEEDINLLREYAGKYGKRTIARMMKKGVNSIVSKANSEGIDLSVDNDPWDDSKVDYLISNINKKSIRQISLFIGIDAYRIKKKCEELNIIIEKTGWTEEEDKLLLENYNKCHYSQLTKIIPGKSKGAILKRARKLNLDVITENTESVYNEEYAKFIHDNWSKMSLNEMSRQLGISKSTVYRYKNKLNLPNVGQKVKWNNVTLLELRTLAKDKTIEELAKHFRTTKSAITKVASKNNIKLNRCNIVFTEDKIHELIELSKDHTVNEVCFIMNIRRSSLDKVVKKYNIVFKKEITGKWTDEEINVLLNIKSNNQLLDIPTIMKLIDKTDETIIKKCRELNVDYIPFSKKEWTSEEIESLLEDAKIYNIKDLVIKYNRSSLSINAKLYKFKMKAVSLNDYWTNDEVLLLRQLTNDNKSINEIAIILNRSIVAVENKLKNEKIKYGTFRLWTKEEEAELIELWDERNIAWLSKKFNRSIEAIKNKAYDLGLKRQFLHQDSLRIEEIAEIFNVRRREVETTWIILGLPYKVEKLSRYSTYKYVTIDNLFLFLEKNQFLYDGKDFEENILGMEPNWVKEKRKHDTFYGFEYDRSTLIKKKLLQQKKYYLELEKEIMNGQKVLKKQA